MLNKKEKMLNKKEKIKLLRYNLDKLKNRKPKDNVGILFGRTEALLAVLGGFDYKKTMSFYSLKHKTKFLGMSYIEKESGTETLIRLCDDYLKVEEE
jgi:hypothetical protein